MLWKRNQNLTLEFLNQLLSSVCLLCKFHGFLLISSCLGWARLECISGSWAPFLGAFAGYTHRTALPTLSLYPNAVCLLSSILIHLEHHLLDILLKCPSSEKIIQTLKDSLQFCAEFRVIIQNFKIQLNFIKIKLYILKKNKPTQSPSHNKKYCVALILIA